jgi:hypothetical protein
MKTCTICFIEKDESEFYKRKSRPIGLAASCRKCHSKKMVAYVKKWKHRLKEELVILAGGKCIDCEKSYPPFVMDFHHRDPEDKLFTVNAGTRNKTKAFEEVKKCDLLCSNCHRTRTHKQRCKGCKHCTGVGLHGEKQP